MRGALATVALVLILASGASAATQTFAPPVVPGPITGDNPKRTLLVASRAPATHTASEPDRAALENLLAFHEVQARKQPDAPNVWLLLLMSLVGAAAMLAFQRARHHQPRF